MGLQAHLLSPESQFLPDVVAVKVNCGRGQLHQGSDLLGRIPLLNEVRYVELLKCQACIRLDPAQEGRCEILEVLLEALDDRAGLLRERRVLEPLDAGQYQVVNVGHDLLFESFAI